VAYAGERDKGDEDAPEQGGGDAGVPVNRFGDIIPDVARRIGRSLVRDGSSSVLIT
jgi:hypothetical protein